MTSRTCSTNYHRHIAVEEYDSLPAAAQSLTDEQWESIERAEAVSTG